MAKYEVFGGKVIEWTGPLNNQSARQIPPSEIAAMLNGTQAAELARLRELYDAARDECEATRRTYREGTSVGQRRERSHHDYVRSKHGLGPCENGKFPESTDGSH